MLPEKDHPTSDAATVYKPDGSTETVIPDPLIVAAIDGKQRSKQKLVKRKKFPVRCIPSKSIAPSPKSVTLFYIVVLTIVKKYCCAELSVLDPGVVLALAGVL